MRVDLDDRAIASLATVSTLAFANWRQVARQLNTQTELDSGKEKHDTMTTKNERQSAILASLAARATAPNTVTLQSRNDTLSVAIERALSHVGDKIANTDNLVVGVTGPYLVTVTRLDTGVVFDAGCSWGFQYGSTTLPSKTRKGTRAYRHLSSILSLSHHVVVPNTPHDTDMTPNNIDGLLSMLSACRENERQSPK